MAEDAGTTPTHATSDASAAQGPILPEAQAVLDADVFPLELTPFEKYVYWDETESMQMVSFFELHFDTPVDVQMLTRVLRVVAHRNPLLACTVVESDGKLMWEYDARFAPQVHLEEEHAVLERGLPRKIDLNSNPGCNFWYRELESEGKISARLLTQVHHAVCDGIGVRRFLVEAFTLVAREYQQQASGMEQRSDDALSGAPRMPRLDLQTLKERGDLGPPAVGLTTWQRIKNAHYFHFKLPQAIRGAGKPSQEQSDKQASEPLRHMKLRRADSEEILDKIRVENLSVNEVSLGLLFRLCRDWNVARGDTNRRSRLRVLMPYEFRSRIDLRMPACNRTSFAFLGRTYEQCDDISALIRGLRDEIAEIKRTRLPMDFIDALQLGTTYPKVFQWLVRKSQRMSTVVMTYSGDLLRGLSKAFPSEGEARRIGDVRLAEVLGAPPVRNNTNIALSLCINWGQLNVSAAWNREVLTGEECQQFLDQYEQLWLEWVK